MPQPGELMRAAAVSTAVLLALMSIGLGRIPGGPAPQPSTPAAVPIIAEIRVGAAAGAVNRRILGNNVLWVDRGDALLTPDGSRFDPQVLDLVKELGSTVLRYPGGSFADTFNWRSGNGPIHARGTSEHFFTRQQQQVLFGTDEFLDLCKQLGAEPLITVNVAGGSPQEAADWVRAVNRAVDGVVAGPVHYWEVGNEPYLKEDVRPEIAVAPSVFADRANAFIRAMREADDTLAIGLPLRLDQLGAVPAVAFPGFADTVLGAINERFDFVALHNAYLPFIFDAGSQYQPEEVFGASMAAYQVVEEDLRRTRLLLDRFHPGRRLPFALTEYNAVYTLGGSIDNNIASLGGALYVADLLRVLATRDDILMANFWSLTGNWVFGMVSYERRLRPAYHVLRAYSEILRGQLLELEVRGPTFDAPAIGAVPATRGVPAIAALATAYAGRTSLLIINKSAHAPAVVTLQGQLGPIRSARELGDERIFDPSHEAGALRWRDVTIKMESAPLRLAVGAHSLLWVEIDAR